MSEITSTQINQAVTNLLNFANVNSIDDDQTRIVQSDTNIIITKKSGSKKCSKCKKIGHYVTTCKADTTTNIIKKKNPRNCIREKRTCAKCNKKGHNYDNCPTYASSIIYQLDKKNTIINRYDNMKDLLNKNPTYQKTGIYKSLSGFSNSAYKYKWLWVDTLTNSDTVNPTVFINHNIIKYKCAKCKNTGHQHKF